MSTDNDLPGFSLEQLKSDQNSQRLNLRIITVEGIFFGLFAALTAMSTYIIIRQPRSRPRLFLLAAILLAFAISTSHIVIHLLTFIIETAYIGFLSMDHSDAQLYNRLYTAAELLRRTAYLLSDIVVVWRTWVIWKDSLLIQIFLAICIAATAATSIALAVFNVFENYRGYHYPDIAKNELGTFCLLFTNVSTTLLIAYKAWIYRRFLREYFAKGSLNGAVSKIFLILIESGTIYCIFWMCMELTDYGYFGDFGFDWMQPHFSGIYMASIILLVSVEKSYSKTIFAEATAQTCVSTADDIEFAARATTTSHDNQLMPMRTSLETSGSSAYRREVKEYN